MSLSQALLPEFDSEMAHTRKSLERIPEDKLEWQPHEKSMSMVGLATHLSNLPSWTGLTISEDRFDYAPPGEEPAAVDVVTSVGGALEIFDKHVAAAREAIAGASDGTLLGPWTLLAGGQELFTMPRIAVLRSFLMNHMIHHRAQLGVYLRLNDIAVPGIYGPTADEDM